jgi:hypothetical protein
MIASGVPDCADGRLSKQAKQADELFTGLVSGAYPYLAPVAKLGGSLLGQFVNQYQAEVAKGTSGALAELATEMGVSPRYAQCGTSVLVVPLGYQITGYRYLAQNNWDWQHGSLLQDCNIQQPPYLVCPLPDGRFQNTTAGNVVISTFINWAREVRFVRVVVYFEHIPPSPFR